MLTRQGTYDTEDRELFSLTLDCLIDHLMSCRNFGVPSLLQICHALVEPPTVYERQPSVEQDLGLIQDKFQA